PAGGYPGWPPNVASDLIPIPVSTELVVGPNRMLVNLITQQNEPLGSADRPVQFKLYNLAADPATAKVDTQATFLPTIQGRPGLYRADVTFDAAGDWGLETITTEQDGSHRSGRMIFSVLAQGTTPRIGDQAPTSTTPTATTADEIAHVSTDTHPDPDFYKVSEPDALTQHKPFVIVFATPAFCRTAMCGPTLDIIKSAAADYKDKLTFIHVEPYQLTYSNGQLQPVLTKDNLPIPVDATNIWGLPTEPYTFVVDSSGKVTAKFEGIVAPEELHAAFDATK
ncbi:MAG TPA: hypothetical protein VFE86_13550, partial [Ilumatobacteraceae bacterium]|nr:hypothetical protein [Ilumatobacteraceae bacterium]